MLTKTVLQENQCRTERQFFNKILEAYFSDNYKTAIGLVAQLNSHEEERLWEYAVSRFILREDAHELMKIMLAASFVR